MTYVLGFQEVDRTQIALVGGKGAHLGELSRIEGVRVPAGFVVTTAAFQRIADGPTIAAQIDALSRVAMPDDLVEAITHALTQLGAHQAYAVRSSATAEDAPTASFAGQHDSYLNIVGLAAILEHIRRCWLSLFSERAVAYRLHHGFDHGTVRMAVVVQQMVAAHAAGVLFTADPVTGHRKVACVEASAGLGEALVSGRVNADAYQVRGDLVRTIEPARGQPVLTEAQVVALAQLGRRIEARFARPQDIEWCLAEGEFHIVQSRPITTLFPIPGPDGTSDGEHRVYVSVGHQQMMTDAMSPLGLSLFQLTAGRPMYEAGGRLFVDVTLGLASPASRAGLLQMMKRSEPLIGDALQTIVDRGDFVGARPDGPAASARAALEVDPAIVAELIERNEASVAALQREIRTKTGPALLDFIRADLQELKRILFDPRSHQVFMTAIEATWWLDDQLHAWLGEANAADPLARSAPGNVTSEMGLALLDVADVIRPHPEVVAYLARTEDNGFLDALPALAGGRAARDAIRGYLDKYGMRCAGEIDLARPRWTERPLTLVPLLLGHLAREEPGSGQRRFAQGQREAATRTRALLDRVRALPDGAQRADEVARRIDQLRAFIGYREYPKYGMIRRYFVYKQALLAEAARLVQTGVLRAADDLFFLAFHELQEVVRTGQVDDALIRDRRDALRSYQALTPPRVITSDGEVITGVYRRDDLPAGALVGLPVSAGIVEGRARVVHDMAAADLEGGDILVTTYTDPSWTPLFVAIAGLVTEVGGLMTHGAVIAREYGLPAVVGVERATQRIRDGQRIRVHGTNGYVELLSAPG